MRWGAGSTAPRAVSSQDAQRRWVGGSDLQNLSNRLYRRAGGLRRQRLPARLAPPGVALRAGFLDLRAQHGGTGHRQRSPDIFDHRQLLVRGLRRAPLVGEQALHERHEAFGIVDTQELGSVASASSGA